jgi:hypothetical protein
VTIKLCINEALYIYIYIYIYIYKKLNTYKVKIKCHTGPAVEYSYSSTLSLTSALDGAGGQRHAPAPFIPGQDPIPIV